MNPRMSMTGRMAVSWLAFACVLLLLASTGLARADHGEPGLYPPTLATFSYCNSVTQEASLSIDLSNYSDGHRLHAVVETPHGYDFDRVLEPKERWGLGGGSGSRSMTAGEITYSLTWEGHAGGADHIAVGQLGFVPIDCPKDEKLHPRRVLHVP